jgi:hypothetical protein
MKREVRKLMKLAKKIVGGETYKKLFSIKKESELEPAVKYILVETLEKDAHNLGKKIRYMKQYGKDVFFAENKYLLLDSKIKHFEASFDEKDYFKIEKIVNDIKKEVANVKSA